MNSETLVFDRYQLHERIGSGGMGVVWKATDQLLHQTVALKHVSFAQPTADQAKLTRDRALREARLAAQLRGHPHVVSVYDVLVDDDGIWLVMEFLPAHSLREFQQMYGRLDPVQVARIGARIADALAAGHALGIEHRDVKPSNILITADGIVKLTDYGISHLIGDPSLTHTGITGTPAYLAPEVAGKGESGPASDVFSLGSTLYAAVEGQPPFGTDDNIFRLLNIVRTGIIRPPTHAGPLEPLLQRLLHVDPATRPDAATVRDMLVRITDPAPAGVRGQKQRTLRWWWPARRRVALVTAALATVAVSTAVLLVAGIGTATPGDPLSPSIGVDAAGDPRDADPCALLNLEALGGFGRAQLTTPPFPASCEAGLITSEGDEFFLQVVLHQPGKSASELSGALRQISGRTVSREDRRPVAATMGCQDWIMPVADEPLISITTLTYDDPAGLCAVTDATTTAAVDALERNGITYLPTRLAGYSLARSDACSTLDDAILSKMPSVDPNDRYRGFANWSCFWDTTDEDGSRVELYFALGKHHPDAAQSTTIAGKKAFLYGQPQSCDAYVEHRPATGTSSAETFFLSVKDPRPTEELCTLASDLATAVATRVPGSFRTADPCPLLNLDALRRFGALQPLPGPWLESCAVDISTANGGTARLRVVLEKYKKEDELEGTPDRVGDLTIFRDDRVSYWGTEDACRRDLVSTSDQPRIAIYAFTYSDKSIDLCAIAEATTATAIDALSRNKGLTYDPDRTSIYAHATSDACTTLDTTALSKVPDLDLNDELPEFANWACRWGTKDNGGTKVSLLLRSEDSGIFGHYEDLKERTFVADKQAFIDGRKQGICKVYVVRQRIDTAVEIFELKVESTRPTADLCGPATQLATAAEEKLPG